MALMGISKVGEGGPSQSINFGRGKTKQDWKRPNGLKDFLSPNFNPSLY
jgi:hypothetical protein